MSKYKLELVTQVHKLHQLFGNVNSMLLLVMLLGLKMASVTLVLFVLQRIRKNLHGVCCYQAISILMCIDLMLHISQ